MVDNKKYKSYLYHEEWMRFFNAMKKIVDSICKKCGKLEDDTDSLRQKLTLVFAEKEDALIKLTSEQEKC